MKNRLRRKSREQRVSKPGFLGAWLGIGARLAGLGLVIVAVVLVLYGWWVDNFRSWQEIEPFRILAIEEKADQVEGLLSLHYLPDRKELVVARLPLTVEVVVPGEYGSYRLGAVGRLSQLERRNFSLLQEAVEEVLALRFDRILVVEPQVESVLPDQTQAIIQTMFLQDLLKPKKTADSKKVWSITRKLHADAVKEVDLARALTAQEPDLDGSVTARFDRLVLDALIEKELVVASQDLAGLTIVVENSVGVPGLATKWSRFLRNGGFDVINVIDSESQLEQSELRFESQQMRSSATGLVLQKVVPTVSTALGDTSEFRSQVVLRLGKDAIEKASAE